MTALEAGYVASHTSYLGLFVCVVYLITALSLSVAAEQLPMRWWAFAAAASGGVSYALRAVVALIGGLDPAPKFWPVAGTLYGLAGVPVASGACIMFARSRYRARSR